MMKRLFPFLVSFVLLASPAGALKMSIWDREMQTTLGAGESSGSRFNVQLIKNYSGPVIVIFSQSDEEKRSGLYTGLQNRYDGVLKNGQLTLMPDNLERSDKPEGSKSNGASPQVAPPPALGNPGNGTGKSLGLTLTKLLQQFKLILNLQTTGQTNPSGVPAEAAPRTPATVNTSPPSAPGLYRFLDGKTR